VSPPIRERDAGQLFEAAADHFKLRNLDLDDFRDKVLESARGNPGQITEMCRLAAQPRYHAGRYIKFSPLRVDTVMKYSMSTSLAPNKASASTAHIMGCGTLVTRPDNKNSRKRGMALGPQAANSSLADCSSSSD
jgi:hypothetical protein